MTNGHLTTIAAALFCIATASGCDTDGKKLRPDQERSKVAAHEAAHHTPEAGGEAAAAGGEAAGMAAGMADGAAAADAKADAPADGADAPADGADAPADGAAAADPQCEAASKNLVKLMKPEMEKQLAQVPEAQRAMVEQQMKSRLTVEALTAQCQQQKPGAEELQCVIDAKTVEALQGCQKRPSGPPPTPRGAAPGGAAPRPVAPPKPTGAPKPAGEPKADGEAKAAGDAE